MALTVLGSTPTAITYNGNELDTLKYNGTIVWEKPPEFADLGSLGFDVDCTIYSTIWGMVIHGYRSTTANGVTGRHHEFWLAKRDANGNWDDMDLIYKTSRPYVQVIYDKDQLEGRAFGIMEYGAEGTQTSYTQWNDLLSEIEWTSLSGYERASDTTYNSKGYFNVFDLKNGNRADSNYALEQRTTLGIMVQSWMYDGTGYVNTTPDLSESYFEYYKRYSSKQNAAAITVDYSEDEGFLVLRPNVYTISGTITNGVLSARVQDATNPWLEEYYTSFHPADPDTSTFSNMIDAFWRAQDTVYRGTLYYPHLQLNGWFFGVSTELNSPAYMQAIRFGSYSGSRTSYCFNAIESSVLGGYDTINNYKLTNVYCKKRAETISIWDPDDWSNLTASGCELSSYDATSVIGVTTSSHSLRCYTNNTSNSALKLHKNCNAVMLSADNGTLKAYRYDIDVTGHHSVIHPSDALCYTKSIPGISYKTFIASTSAPRMSTSSDLSDMVYGDMFNYAGRETSYYAAATANKRYYGKYQEYFVYSLSTQHLYWLKIRV